MSNEPFALEMYMSGQNLAPDEAKVVSTAYKRLRIWRDGCREIHDRAKIARKILLLQDPYQDQPNTPVEKKTLQLQTLKSTFNNCVADQMDNVMEAVMTPETVMLQDVTDDINDIVRFIYERNDYQAMHRMRVQDYLCTGTSVTQVMWDDDALDGQGDVTLVRVPIESFLWDPAEDKIENARALFKISWHPLSWYCEHFENGKYVQSDEHSDVAVGENENQEELAADEKKAMLLEYWWREYDNGKNEYTINVAYIAGGALLEMRRKVYAHGMYPFVLDVFTEIEGLPVGEGLVMELAPMMRYINRYAHYIDIYSRASAKIRMLVRRNSNIDLNALENWNSDLINGDAIGEDAVRFMEPPTLSALVQNTMFQMQTDLKQDSGQNQFSRGETAGGVTAASAIASLQEAGGKQTRMRTEVLKRGFRRITEQVLWLISQFYDEKRVILITGKNGGYREVDMSPSRIMGRRGNVIPRPPYAVRIEVQRLNPAVVSSQNQLYIDAYKMSAESGNVFPLSVLFRMLNVDGKDRILPILDSLDTQTQQMQQLAQQNEQLAQTVQRQQQSIDGMKNLISQSAISSMNTSSQSSAAERQGITF